MKGEMNKNEILQQMSTIYDDLVEAKLYLDENHKRYTNTVSQHKNYSLEIDRLIEKLKSDNDKTSEIDIVSNLVITYRKDRETQSRLDEFKKNCQSALNRYNELVKNINLIIDELKNCEESEEYK